MTIPLPPKKKILGVGPAQCALEEFAALTRDYEVYMIERGPREPVKQAIREACERYGPFEAAFILFANASYGPMDEDLLGPMWVNGNNVGVFAQCGIGYNNVKVDDISGHGCYFTNTPDAVTAATADFTVNLFLNVLRATSYCEMVARSGLWHKGLELSTDPAGLTLGIFGMGRIGKDFVRKVRAFGVNILYHTRTPLSIAEEEELGARYASKEDLLRSSDVISCLVPGNAETHHMIGEKEFDLMKDGVFFINSSRGSVVCTDSLIAALESGKVKRAALDVYENEPGIPAYFLNNPRVTATPHVAAYTTGAIKKGETDAFNNVRTFLERGKPIHNVNGPF